MRIGESYAKVTIYIGLHTEKAEGPLWRMIVKVCFRCATLSLR